MRALLKRIRHHLVVLAAVLGPGFVIAHGNSDAGGLFTYTHAGARWGFMPLWTLVPVAIVLLLALEMSARLGAVTNKGLSDLIREEFGLRATFLVMAVLVAVNLTNVVAEFAGIAACLKMYGIRPILSIPVAALLLWLIVVGRRSGVAEKLFLLGGLTYLVYIVAGVLARPDWQQAALSSVRPSLILERPYLRVLLAMIGTSVAPWVLFYLQESIVEKDISADEYSKSRIEILVGGLVVVVIAFFMVVASAGTIHDTSPQGITSAAQASLTLRPLGSFAPGLFTIVLLNGAAFALLLLPLATATTVCAGLGFESGTKLRLREAPFFYGLYTAVLLGGAIGALLPGLPLVRTILFAQVLNALLLPLILVFMLRLANRQRLMKTWTNSWPQNTGVALAILGLAALAILAFSPETRSLLRG